MPDAVGELKREEKRMLRLEALQRGARQWRCGGAADPAGAGLAQPSGGIMGMQR